MKHAGGRPTKLTDELIEKAWRYILPNADDQIDKRPGYIREGEVLPTMEGLSLWLDVSRARIYEWKEKSEQFRDVYEKAMTMQGRSLVNKGVNGGWQPTITKLLLNKHGYVEEQKVDNKTETTVTVTNNQLSDEELDERINKIIAGRKD